MGAMATQITSLTIVYSTVYSGADKRKHQSSASPAFMRGIHRWPVNSPHKCPVTRKMFHLMTSSCNEILVLSWKNFKHEAPRSSRSTNPFNDAVSSVTSSNNMIDNNNDNGDYTCSTITTKTIMTMAVITIMTLMIMMMKINIDDGYRVGNDDDNDNDNYKNNKYPERADLQGLVFSTGQTASR